MDKLIFHASTAYVHRLAALHIPSVGKQERNGKEPNQFHRWNEIVKIGICSFFICKIRVYKHIHIDAMETDTTQYDTCAPPPPPPFGSSSVNIRNVYDVWNALDRGNGQLGKRYRINLNNKCSSFKARKNFLAQIYRILRLHLMVTKSHRPLWICTIPTFLSTTGIFTMRNNFQYADIKESIFFPLQMIWNWGSRKNPRYFIFFKSTANVLLFQLSLKRTNCMRTKLKEKNKIKWANITIFFCPPKRMIYSITVCVVVRFRFI